MMSILKTLRLERGMTQRELADASGVDIRKIQHYEQGYRDIHRAELMTVARLANALGCSLEVFVNEASD